MRVGFGYDIHRLVRGRMLVLGGVEIPSEAGEEGFSDGDALIHAVIDSLLGPCGLGDIGENFPPGDERYRNADSRTLLRQVRAMIGDAGFRIGNLDCVVVLEKPRILPFVPRVRQAIADDLGISADRVNVRGKTKEGVDATGEGRAVEAYAVALLTEGTA
ncbi:MAG TPA: 2-C-methyl-D-erythritol 2,4-cyclodiphosphate synthase [Spirochaetia bacterium]|nr:2-C-methyl-D-erythritol 2,4-cyclodiphosphate synthase [Spirochaetia bacterium]